MLPTQNSEEPMLHRHIWQRLPQPWRRRALFYATSRIAPRPTPAAQGALPIIVAGALRTASGLGQSARLCHDALKSVGLQVFGVDLTRALMQSNDYSDFQFDDGSAIEGPGTLVLFINAPFVPLAMWRLGRKLVRDKRVVGYWAWELPEVPKEWRHGVPLVHEVWTPTRFVADAVRPIVGAKPVHIIPYPVAIEAARPRLAARAADRPFTVLTIFNMASSFARKNPCASIEAFRMAFGGDPTARLVIKTSNLSVYPEGIRLMERTRGTADNIDIIAQTMSAAGIDALYDQVDVVMSLHRSEGFGLTIAEAMLRGVPVVATNWSGNVDFLNHKTGIPIPFHLISALDPQGTYNHPDVNWADADIEAAAAALRRLRDDPGLRLRLGQQAAHFGEYTWSAERYVSTVRQHLGL